MSKTSALICLILTVGLGLFLYYHADIDLQVTQHFYLGQNSFALEQADWARWSRSILYWVVYVMVVGILCLLILCLCRPKFKLIPLKTLIYTLLVFLVVPVLIINLVFKDQSGRPRPRDVTQFGGQMTFQQPWTVSSQCPTNCSFVCGDCAVAFAFWVFLPFFKKRRYKLAYGVLVFLVGAFYGYIRIGQGAHFFSDVIFSGLISYLGIWLVYAYFYLYQPKWAQEENLKNAFIKAHRLIFRN